MIIDRAQLAVALPAYEIGQPLGRGAHGLVFSARHRRLGSQHAVKALVVADRDGPDASRRFLTEARVMTALDHPHIVRVDEYAEGDAVLLLVLEHLGGGTLTTRMGGPVAPGVAAAWMLGVAEALSVAHRHGVVHRDVKPANLLFTTGGLLKVSDFGVAKLFAGPDASASADIVGTPRYVAPEQISGGRIGPATDLYALGVTFYELLAGRSPFPADLSLPGLLHHHLSMPPEPLDGVPPSIAALVGRLLAKDAADRPESARQLAADLVAAGDRDLGRDWISRSGVPLRIDGALLHQRPAQPPPARRLPAEKRIPRRTVLAGVAAAAVLATATGTALIVRTGRSADAAHTETASATKAPAAHRATLVAAVTAPGVADVVAVDANASHVAWIATGGQVRVWEPVSDRRIGPLGGADAGVWSAAFVTGGDPTPSGPDAGLLLTGGQDGFVRQWDPGTGRANGASVPVAHENTKAVAYDRDGATMAAGGEDGVVRIWDALTAEEAEPSLRGHTSPVAAIAFDPTRTRIATAAGDGVRLWNAGSHREVRYQPGRGAATTHLVFSADGSRLASAGPRTAVRLWDARTGAPVGPAIDPGPTGTSIAVGFSRDSRTLLTCAGDTVRWWDATSGTAVGAPLRLPAGAPVRAAAFTPDGAHAVTAGTDGSVRLWRLR